MKGWLDEAAAGSGRAVFLAGEAGIGKTVLVSLFTRSIVGLARVARGQCDPLSTPRALGPLVDAAPVLGSQVQEAMEGGAAPDRLFRAILSALNGGRRPTVLVLEDIHWADGATLDLLRFLVRRVTGTRAMLLATYREDEVGPSHPLTRVLGDLATTEGTRRMLLPALSVGAVETLARGSGLDGASLHRLTGGNPFFVTECLAGRSESVPVTVRDAVLARAARLSASGRGVLDAAAVIGAEAELDLLQAAAGTDIAAIDKVVTAGMLRGGERTVSFRHELARQAILSALSPQRAQRLHRSVLDILIRRRHGDPARMAHHAEAAGDDALTLRYASEAGRRAAQMGSHREAAAQYARALRVAAELPSPARAELLGTFAEACGLSDHLDRALQALDEVLAIWRAEGDARREAAALTRRSLYHVRAGRNANGERDIRIALDLLVPLAADKELASALRAFAYIRMLNRDNEEAVAWGERAIALAERVGDTRTLVGAHNAIGSALILSGETDRGVGHLETSRRLAAESGLQAEVSNAHVNLGSALGEVFQLQRADRYLHEGLAYALEHDLDPSRHYILAWRALSHLYQGRWDAAEADARIVVQISHASTISRITALIALGRVLTRRGDSAAQAALDEAKVLADRTATLQRVGPVRAARAEAAWLAGDAARATEEARPGYDLAAKHRHPWFGGELAYWLWTVDALETMPDWLAEPYALQLARRWAEAAAAWEALGCPYEQARALAHSTNEAALRRAHQLFERLGARPMAAVVARRLRAAGIKNIPRGPRPATRARPGGLTAREVEIVTLLAAGLRNPEIAQRLYVSAKTVDHHVSSILGKLGVRSRAEVVREAARLGLLDVPASPGQPL